MEAVGYTSREAAGLFGLTPNRVRAMARAGLLNPERGARREYRFSFQDLVLLRTLKSLIDARLPRGRAHRALRQLLRQLPEGRKASEIRLAADGGHILAHDGGMVWSPESGQILMDFAAAGGSAVAALSPFTTTDAAAEEWYQHGLDLEPFDVEGAKAGYLQALDLAPEHGGAHVNLGRLLQSEGGVVEAIGHYRAALDADPCHVTAAFNLGTALEEAGLTEEAIAAYRLALSVHPALADAHYNLSLLYQRTGHKLASLVHLKRYRELVGTQH
jgi:tetratricopeptide (TPR) repeat protein